MIAMGVMQMPVDQIVDMIPVRNRLMPTARAMLMPWFVPVALVLRGADISILLRNRQHMLLDLPILPLMMQMPIV